MNPNHEDHTPMIVPDGFDWDADETDPCEPIYEWLTMEGCDRIGTDEYGVVVSAELNGVEYHVGPSTDPELGSAEIIATLVMGSPMPTDLLETLVTAHLPHPLPHDLAIEMGELGENDAHCWLVRRFTDEHLDDEEHFARSMEEFTSVARTFVDTWTAA